MEQQLTPSQQSWFDLAAMHADDFATRAEQHDRENTFPFENYEALKASGYSKMTYPAELGGGGASLMEMCIAQGEASSGRCPHRYNDQHAPGSRRDGGRYVEEWRRGNMGGNRPASGEHS